MSGAGKSYFLNGLMGNQDPDAGPFGVGDSTHSCTKDVTGYSGSILNKKYTKYGIQGLQANFYDTPGFSDSDSCLIEKNKKLIAKNLDKEIDMFLYVWSSPRFLGKIKEVFKQLNDWTAGQIWKNFVIVFAKLGFDNRHVKQRFDKGESAELKIKTDVEAIIEDLGKEARDQQWMIKDENTQKERQMNPSDFENIKYSMLNVNQITHCKLNESGFFDSSEHCWKQPDLDGNLDYQETGGFDIQSFAY